MPIVYQKEASQNVKLAVWYIEETAPEILPLVFTEDRNDITEPLLEKKKLEIIATRLILKNLVEKEGLQYHGISKDQHGKPHLKGITGIHISISHAYPYAAAILDRSGSTGIDIEAPRDQIHRIKHKFLSEGELKATASANHLTILWAAKECLYKIHGRKQLIFKKHLSVEFQNDQLLTGEIRINDLLERFNLRFEKIEAQWLVYKEHALKLT